MVRHCRTALTRLAVAVALTLPVPLAFAQDEPPNDPSGVVDPQPDDTTPPDQQAADATTAAPPTAQAQPQGRRPSRIARRLAGWVSTTKDNGGLPFLIVDKLGASIFAFDPSGAFLGSAPVLVGLARGDDSAPGIGDLKLSQISDDQRTTPAGRFVARFGASDGHGQMLWVDLPDAISLHPVMSVDPGEHRSRRIKSTDPEQHRISYGCINVPAMFYHDVVLPALRGGAAVVYVLPDTKPMRDIFPAFAAAVGGNEDEAPGDRARSADLLSDAPAPLQRLD